MKTGFLNRTEAGERLALHLARYAHRSDVLVLALPRGGVPVGFVVAQRLQAPLDIVLVHKLGAPGQPELALGAIASGNRCALNQDLIDAFGLPPGVIAAAIAREQAELDRRAALYRRNRPPLDVTWRTVILVDDGIATGATMRAAILALRIDQPHRLVIAAPTIAAEARDLLRKEVDEVVSVLTPASFSSVGEWYGDFSQTTDQEVCALLAQGAGKAGP